MKDLQIKGKKVDEGTSAPDEEPNEDSDDLVRLFIWLFIRRWNDIHLPLHPPLKVLHPVLHPTLYPALKWSRNQKDSVYRGKYEDTYFRICQNLPTSQIRTPKICIFILSSKNTLAYKSDQVIGETKQFAWEFEMQVINYIGPLTLIDLRSEIIDKPKSPPNC